jgi:hypothetical protein
MNRWLMMMMHSTLLASPRSHRSVLHSHGVDASLASDADVPSGQAYILLQPQGQNSIILVGAANHVSTRGRASEREMCTRVPTRCTRLRACREL